MPRNRACLPLAGWADRQLGDLAGLIGWTTPWLDTGERLLGLRARLNGFRVPGAVSAGGGCRLLPTRDGWIALNLARPDDRAMLPALIGDANLAVDDEAGLRHAVRNMDWRELLDQGRLLGLAMAGLDETPASPAVARPLTGTARHGARPFRDRAPVVVDLSALWAGPLAGHLLGLGGARVIKVESPSRPDSLRSGDPALFGALNRTKEQTAIDLRAAEGRAALLELVRHADVVIEAARPRALLQLGIDADALVRTVPGLVWVTITGHGITGEAGHWVGFGDDAGVAGGLSAALYRETGRIGFVGDAIADPLTGITAAREAAQQVVEGTGARIVLSMSGVAARALAESRAEDPAGFAADLRDWAARHGQPIVPAG
ncbi:CoA transferase [Novosphingobium aerophilum]|uniref:CoA transferase n=1 Tax=Novosphingobium aerophilum TaxID=2839843 RepID=UPI001FD19608|nr:CoA transferase [Novosphingobium aerophilum]